MPTGYQHLTRRQRCQIADLKASGIFQSEIAKIVGVSASSISRELNRNKNECGIYNFHDADTLAWKRRIRLKYIPRCMTPEVIGKIETHLREDWSPEQISGRLKLEGVFVSHERIYQHIWINKKRGGKLYKHLRHSNKKYRRRSSGKAGRSLIPNRIDIKERPKVVETKSRIGDWEGDTIVGSKQQGAILSYVDRKSKYTILAQLPVKTAENVVLETIKRFSDFRGAVHTITYDNGSEFSLHDLISKEIGVQCYFSTPYHSWERGLNEHTNGLVRQYFPKGTNLKLVRPEEVMHVENKLNNRPRKVLGYRNPKEVWLEAIEPTQRIALST